MPRKSKEFLRRSKAAKKGWKTRRRRYGPSGRKNKPIGGPGPGGTGNGVEIEVGYDSAENGFSMTIAINTHKDITKMSTAQIVKLIRNLAKDGHFDESENNPNYDLRWTAELINNWNIVRTGVDVPKGSAYLEGFGRFSPGSL